MWTALKYVGSGLTLVAFICALAAWLYRYQLQKKERLIKSVPEDERARLVEQTLVLFKVDSVKLTREQQYNLALRQIREHARKYQVTAAVIVIFGVLAAVLTFFAMPRLIQAPVPAPTTPTPVPPSGKLSAEIEEVKVAPQPGGNTQVFIRLSIKNTGSPTGVHQYAVHINHVSSRNIEYKGPLDDFGGRYSIPQPDGKKPLVIQQADSIMSKTRQAIRTEDRVSGWLRITLPLPEDVLRQPGIRYTVSFADATGKRYEVTHEVR